jgi:hypothetical protein
MRLGKDYPDCISRNQQFLISGYDRPFQAGTEAGASRIQNQNIHT